MQQKPQKVPQNAPTQAGISPSVETTCGFQGSSSTNNWEGDPQVVLHPQGHDSQGGTAAVRVQHSVDKWRLCSFVDRCRTMAPLFVLVMDLHTRKENLDCSGHDWTQPLVWDGHTVIPNRL